MESVTMRTTTKHVDGTEVTVVVSTPDMMFAMKRLSFANVLTLKQMFAKQKMEILVKCHSHTKVHLTRDVQE